MFFKNKILFFILQFIFCIFLVYFINQQIILIGILDNLVIDLIIIYMLIIFMSGLISKILTFIYMIFSKFIILYQWFCLCLLYLAHQVQNISNNFYKIGRISFTISINNGIYKVSKVGWHY